MSSILNRKMRLGASIVAAVMVLGLPIALYKRAHADLPATYVTLKDNGAISRARLATAIEPLFDRSGVGATQAIIVMRDGQIIAERYADGIGPDTKLLSRSIAKTVTATLVGLMVSDGRLALDSPVPIPAWNQPGDPRGSITLRQLLQMTSGLEHDESGDPLYRSDTVRMLFTDGAQDMAAFAEAKPIARRPGSGFVYSTADTMILCDLMTRMLTTSEQPDIRRDAMLEFVRGRLMAPVGLTSLTPEFDARGTMIGGSMMHMTARDYARFGELLRNQGRVNGHQLLPARWVTFMTTPSPRNPAFGGHLWLNRAGEDEQLFDGEGPRHIFAAAGYHGQYVIIAPAQRLVIVRMGVTTAGQRAALRDRLLRLVETYSSS